MGGIEPVTIRKIVRTPSCDWEVYISTAECFAFNDEDYAGQLLREGAELNEEWYDALKQASELHLCAKKATSCLAGSAMSKRRLYSKLTAHFDKQTAAAIADRFEAKGLLCDMDFALDKAIRMKSEKNYGPTRIKNDLVQVYGVPGDIAKQVMDDEELADFSENLRAMIERKFSRADLADREGRHRAASTLMRNGYSFEEARAALIEFINRK